MGSIWPWDRTLGGFLSEPDISFCHPGNLGELFRVFSSYRSSVAECEETTIVAILPKEWMMQEQHNAGKPRPNAPTKPADKHLHTWLSLAVLTSLSLSGCASQSGSKAPAFSISNAGQGVRNQISSVGAAVSSAYTKTKTAIAAPFTPVSASSMETADGESNSATNPLSIAPDTFVAQGNYFESQGNYTKALDSYSRALEAEPKNAVAMLSTARLYDRQQDTAKAIEFYQRTIQIAPSNADACMELGRVYTKSGDLTSAQQHLRKAVELQPTNKSYRHALAGALLDAGDTNGSMAELARCETPAMAQYQMAYLQFQRKNIPATQQYLSEALKIDPNLKPARDLLTSISGTANIDQLVDRSRQVTQQASGIYRQVGVVTESVSNALNAASGTAPQSNPVVPPSVPPSNGNLLDIPVVPYPSTLVPGENPVRVRMNQ
jgi:tetratricopeptide (TPR) repeat protein